MSLLIALILGVTCGAIPVILGAIMEELEVGVLGFVGIMCKRRYFSVYMAMIPGVILCAFYILRHACAKQLLALITLPKLFHSQLNDAVVLPAYKVKSYISGSFTAHK